MRINGSLWKMYGKWHDDYVVESFESVKMCVMLWLTNCRYFTVYFYDSLGISRYTCHFVAFLDYESINWAWHLCWHSKYVARNRKMCGKSTINLAKPQSYWKFTLTFIDMRNEVFFSLSLSHVCQKDWIQNDWRKKKWTNRWHEMYLKTINYLRKIFAVDEWNVQNESRREIKNHSYRMKRKLKLKKKTKKKQTQQIQNKNIAIREYYACFYLLIFFAFFLFCVCSIDSSLYRRIHWKC